MEKILAYIQIGLTITLIYPIAKLLIMYFKIFIWYMFNLPIFWWNKDIEKPRLLFSFFGILFIFSSWILFLKSEHINIVLFEIKIKVYWELILALLLNITGLFILFYMWSENFTEKLLPFIRRKIAGEDIKSPFENGYDLKNVLEQLIELEYIDCDLDSFHSLLSLKELQEDTKIVFFKSKRDLVRFIFFIFSIEKHTKHDSIKRIIYYYFINEYNKPYNLDGLSSDISKVRMEIINKEIIYTTQEETILTTFQRFKQEK